MRKTWQFGKNHSYKDVCWSHKQTSRQQCCIVLTACRRQTLACGPKFGPRSVIIFSSCDPGRYTVAKRAASLLLSYSTLVQQTRPIPECSAAQWGQDIDWSWWLWAATIASNHITSNMKSLFFRDFLHLNSGCFAPYNKSSLRILEKDFADKYLFFNCVCGPIVTLSFVKVSHFYTENVAPTLSNKRRSWLSRCNVRVSPNSANIVS